MRTLRSISLGLGLFGAWAGCDQILGVTPGIAATGGGTTTSGATGGAKSSSSTTSSSSSSAASSTTTSSASSGGAGGAASSSTTSSSTSASTSSSSSSAASSASSTSGAGAAGACPGEPVTLAPGQVLSRSGDTTGATDKFANDQAGLPGSNCLGGPFPGSDLVYAVTTTAAGTVTATLDASFEDPYVHVRTACPGDPSVEIACEWSNSGPNTVTFLAAPGTTYFVAADGWGGVGGVYAGPFMLKLSLSDD